MDSLSEMSKTSLFVFSFFFFFHTHIKQCFISGETHSNFSQEEHHITSKSMKISLTLFAIFFCLALVSMVEASRGDRFKNKLQKLRAKQELLNMKKNRKQGNKRAEWYGPVTSEEECQNVPEGVKMYTTDRPSSLCKDVRATIFICLYGNTLPKEAYTIYRIFNTMALY